MTDTNTDTSSKRFSHGVICLLLILAAALIARIGLLAMKPDFSYPDEWDYLDIAKNIASDNQYKLTEEGPANGYAIRQTPGLPVVLGIIGKALPLSCQTAKLINTIAGWSTAVVYAWALWLATGHIWIVAAGAALIGFHPTFLYMGNTNYPQTFQALMLAFLVAAICFRKYRANNGDSPGWTVAEGALTGLGALFVPTQCFILPALVIARWKSGLKKLLLQALILFVSFMAVLTPWIARNAVTEKAFIPFSTNGGEQMFLGFNDDAGMNTGIMINITPGLYTRLTSAASGREREIIFRDEAFKWIRADYGRAARLWILKALNYFRWDTGKMVTAEEEGGAVRLWITRLTSISVFGLAITGLWRLIKHDDYWCILTAVFMLCLAAGHAFFISRYRYRIPIEQALIFIGLTGIRIIKKGEIRK